ncbi:extracellular catalytic domain type 1 short-chain-length polyhydroxyalkanoate depolymerase [Micromonospora sp. NBC_01813]|uniref:extracellular catalytic domain type 1 short-chain-length polyhydroxyalkanoate depolymerase n=1 Tax=Micromonospora sp. NBC_01813 TaxID=2975988 RepID=UPI002DD9CB6E|nr:PHB depolymerase family esterase [Micromonospora sp. NBC_01813]WSA10288.1 PHB depolymerase family esterase [Micromonospora sp. NBC_01813]
MRIKRKLLMGMAMSLVAAGLVMPALTPAHAASLVEVTSFGNNPGGMRMHVYVPDTRPTNPAIVVAMHGCGGNGPGFYSGSEFAGQADRYGFIVIYPSAMQQAGFGNCFDVWSAAAKQRNGGSDPVSIMSMVNYVQQQYRGDPNRVYATGSSSGGMMTNHMLALYPDVFKAGAAFMGVPFNCFANAADYPPGSSQCTGGNMNRTPQQWGDAVRQAYPGYSGPRPRVQLWHGTNDTLVPYSLLQEAVEQWTNVFGLSQTPTSTDTPQANWNRRRFADNSGTVQVEAYAIQGAGHSLPSGGMAAAAVTFFGLTAPPPTTAPPTTAPPTTAPPTTAPPTTAPPTTAPPTTAPPTTPPPTSGACRVTATVNAWNNGLTENFTIRNTGSSAINGWSLVFTLPGGQNITGGWNASYSPSSGQVTARNMSYNGSIPVNGQVDIGFQATHTGNTAKPSSFTLNGAVCTVA